MSIKNIIGILKVLDSKACNYISIVLTLAIFILCLFFPNAVVGWMNKYRFILSIIFPILSVIFIIVVLIFYKIFIPPKGPYDSLQ